MAEEGRLAPELAAKAAASPREGSQKKSSRKRTGKQVLAADSGATLRPVKKASSGGGSGGRQCDTARCPIHANSTHDAQDCRILQDIKQRREQRHKERRAAGACFNCGDIGHLSRYYPNDPRAGPKPTGGNAGREEAQGGRGQARAGRERPPWGWDRARAEEQRESDCTGGDEPGFQIGRAHV